MNVKYAFRSSMGFRWYVSVAIVILASFCCRNATAQENEKAADTQAPLATPDPANKTTARPEPLVRKVKRAARPAYPNEQTGDVFFNDVFTEALLGARPATAGDKAVPVIVGSNMSQSSSVNAVSDTALSGSAWSTFITASILEDEIKRQQIRLSGLVTNPGQFKTRNAEIGETFQMLAMTFAIVSQYDEQVRWKDQSVSVTTAMIESAKQARGTDIAAFENAQRTTQRLADLVRGGNFGEEVIVTAIEDWSGVVDRTALMNRLDAIVTGPLKTATSSKDGFAAETESIVHEAAIMAAVGRVLQLPAMDDADDEVYSAFATEMIAASRLISSAAIANDLEAAAIALNQISQSCVRCHADYR